MSRVLHRNVALLRVADAQALAEIRALVPLDTYVIGELSPTELVIDPSRVRALVELLENRGLTALIRKLRIEG